MTATIRREEEKQLFNREYKKDDLAQPAHKSLTRAIILILMAAALAGLLLSYLNHPSGSNEPGKISIKSQGKVIAVLTMQDIKALPKIEKRVTINSGSEGKSAAVWGGASMKAVLDSVDPKLLQSTERVLTRAEDGFTSDVSAEEIIASDDVMIAYEQDGQALKGKSAGGLGPFRLILAADPFGNRMTKYLNELELQ